MLVIKNIRLQNFRLHKDIKVNFDEKISFITGKNGTGKTTILEAVYYVLQGKSFKGSDADILKHNENWWKIESDVDNSSRKISYNSELISKKKKYNHDENISYRMASKNKYPVVLFEPEDLRLLNGSPARRRKFLDVFISQLDSSYSAALRKYERTLKQRNSLLKKENTSPDDLFVWNINLSEYGSYIIEQRVRFIEQINKDITEVYRKISHTKDEISAHYSHTLIENTKQKMFSELEKNFTKDKILKTTTVGPHRHDMLFLFNNSPALATASRGEIRSIVLALKFLEVEVIKKLDGRDPVVLLDDVFSELDEDRQKALSDLTDLNQVIITSTVVSKDQKTKSTLISV